MKLGPILVFIPIALAAGRWVPRRWRVFFLLCASLLAMFWLQPALPIRSLDFWLPLLSIGLVFLTWTATRSPANLTEDSGGNPADRWAMVAIGGVILAVALTRYAGPVCCLTAGRPPAFWQVIGFIAFFGGIGALFSWLGRSGQAASRVLPVVMIVLLTALLVILKSPAMTRLASAWLRALTGQPVNLAAATDLAWLGYSFLAFRLLHVLRDFQAKKLPGFNLAELSSYAIFYPAYTAGPIDRSQRWIGELRANKQPSKAEILQGLKRILLGIFKKFVLADSLALLAVNSQNAAQVDAAFWAWVMLYAYALRIYLDFSGYTDIALGLGQLAGFRLPENFNSPYLKTNLTAFWNSWHMTLAQWFRAYIFNPLTRSLRSQAKLPAWSIIFMGQVITMFLIGLWHGITINFAIWGLWHGLGLFVHNRWAEWSRPRLALLDERPAVRRAAIFGGWFLTFQYVTLGWVWFALPAPAQAIGFFQNLLGK